MENFIIVTILYISFMLTALIIALLIKKNGLDIYFLTTSMLNNLKDKINNKNELLIKNIIISSYYRIVIYMLIGFVVQLFVMSKNWWINKHDYYIFFIIIIIIIFDSLLMYKKIKDIVNN